MVFWGRCTGGLGDSLITAWSLGTPAAWDASFSAAYGNSFSGLSQKQGLEAFSPDLPALL